MPSRRCGHIPEHQGETPGIKAIKEFAESSLDKLMSLVGSKLCLENWNKFNAFFKCIYDIIKVNVTATRYLIRKDTIKNLIDFMLGNESPYATERRIPMGGSKARLSPVSIQLLLL